MWCLLCVAFAIQPGASNWEFHDAAAHESRSLVTFRPVELADQPPRPLRPEDRPAGKARYGLLPVGNWPSSAVAIVWLPEAQEVWLDADDDGRFGPGERHKLGDQPLSVPAVVKFSGPGPQPRKLQKTIMLRRASNGGLRYAVRGYVTGKLRLGGQDYAALLTDGNADGCFDSPGADRVWIDLDRDGHFDALTEQFPLGKPLTIGGKTYLLKPAADGSDVQVRERPAEEGALRLTLPGKSGESATNFAVHLVSDWGELITVPRPGEKVVLPVGRYTVDSLTFQLADAKGRQWQYYFAGVRRFAIEVSAGRETEVDVLRGLTLGMTVEGAKDGVPAGATLEVTPTLQTPAGLYLVNCRTSERHSDHFISGNADIRLLGPEGPPLDQCASDFM